MNACIPERDPSHLLRKYLDSLESLFNASRNRNKGCDKASNREMSV